ATCVAFLMQQAFSKRVVRLRGALEAHDCDALLVSHLPGIYYLTGFHGSAGLALVERGATTLFVDGRYTAQARSQAAGCRVTVAKSSLLEALAAHLGARRGRTVGFEAAWLTVAQLALLRRRCRPGTVRRWVATEGLVESLRSQKDAGEVRAIAAAAKLGCRVLEGILPLVRPGVREAELAGEIEYRMRKLGASGPAFETIVASGKRSALPHARPSTRKLRRNELVVLDMGAILGHYCCDLTRTIYLGNAPPRVQGWHQAVREAHQAAAAALRPGVTGEQVDEAARAVLRKHGLERRFIHSSGHGLGLEVHEEPRLARGSKAVLKAGNVVTIEPGVYIEGAGGIRIEDDYVVTATGAERLTQACQDVFSL
ncbi:MAG: M24 family metallopeptidase, partial [Candidatus Acidiferrales bacterium]